MFLSTVLFTDSLLDLDAQPTRVRRAAQKDHSKEGQPSKRYRMSVHGWNEILRQNE